MLLVHLGLCFISLGGQSVGEQICFIKYAYKLEKVLFSSMFCLRGMCGQNAAYGFLDLSTLSDRAVIHSFIPENRSLLWKYQWQGVPSLQNLSNRFSESWKHASFLSRDTLPGLSIFQVRDKDWLKRFRTWKPSSHMLPCFSSAP